MAIGPLGILATPKQQFFVPGTLTPAVGAKVFTYAAGTTTKQATYISDNQTPNTNPIILDANGQCVCFVDTTLKYDFTFAPSTDTDPPTAPYWTVGSIGFAEMITSFAPLASPAFTGTPTAPTPSLGDSSTNVATTQFVQNNVATGLNNANLGGTPTAPTATPGTFTTQIATTAFVGSEIARAWSIQAFPSSGSFTVPAGVTALKYRVWGAGGGGGGSTGSSSSGGGGGGGGGFTEGVATVAPATVLAISIGTGGTGGTGGSAGTSGSATSVSVITVSAGGGGGGNAGVSSSATPGGSGGSGSGGSFAITGGTGGTGYSFGSGLPGIGVGGGAFCSTVSTPSAGNPAGGGSGGANSSPGVNGSSGLVIFEWMKP